MKIVVYTAAFGDDFGFIPQKKQKGFDYICFTDRMKKVPKPWKCVVVEGKNLPNDTLRNRQVKLLPHLFFKEYDYSIYIDSNYLIIGNLQDYVQELNGYKMGIYDHNQASDKRDCVYDEYLAILELGKRKGVYKDDPETMKKQMDFFRSKGYPEHNGLIFAAVLIRKHNDPEVIQLMEDWWSFVSTRSKRDQLSFDYVRWKNNFKPYVYSGRLRNGNPYFYLLGSNRKNYLWKLFRYKFKKFFNLNAKS